MTLRDHPLVTRGQHQTGHHRNGLIAPAPYRETPTAAVATAEQQPPILVEAPARGRVYHVGKRVFDLALGSIGLVVSSPIMLALAIIIRLDSPGPAVFRQKRLGKGGRPFTFYKFRTMRIDARTRYPQLYAYSYSPEEIATMYFKVLDDPRLTRFGRHLRKTSLDELPNFINVLRGDMSLVGPRPELPEMLPYYTPQQTMKFSVLPGLTGLAQVTGRAVLTFQETIVADLDYCERRSLWFDVLILLRTIKTVILRVGAF